MARHSAPTDSGEPRIAFTVAGAAENGRRARSRHGAADGEQPSWFGRDDRPGRHVAPANGALPSEPAPAIDPSRTVREIAYARTAFVPGFGADVDLMTTLPLAPAPPEPAPAPPEPAAAPVAAAPVAAAPVAAAPVAAAPIVISPDRTSSQPVVVQRTVVQTITAERLYGHVSPTGPAPHPDDERDGIDSALAFFDRDPRAEEYPDWVETEPPGQSGRRTAGQSQRRATVRDDPALDAVALVDPALDAVVLDDAALDAAVLDDAALDAVALENLDRPWRTRRSRRHLGRAGWLIGVAVVSVLVALVMRALVVQSFWIPSGSMEPTLHGCSGCQNDRVLVDKVSYHLHAIGRGDVIVFRRPPGVPEEDTYLIKRVIGLTGETVSARDGKVIVGNRALVEPYLNPDCDGTEDFGPVTVPSGDVFVMGDNRCGSLDSRFFGPIKKSTVVGRAFIRIWPLKRLHWL